PRTLTFNRMKTTNCTLLIIILLLQLVTPVNTGQTLESLLEKKIKEILGCGGDCHSTMTKTLSCTSVTTKGRLASCPA
ncbi:hypothetical protein STEG23_002081, partial [Scotinomys teguina]